MDEFVDLKIFGNPKLPRFAMIRCGEEIIGKIIKRIPLYLGGVSCTAEIRSSAPA